MQENRWCQWLLTGRFVKQRRGSVSYMIDALLLRCLLHSRIYCRVRNTAPNKEIQKESVPPPLASLNGWKKTLEEFPDVYPSWPRKKLRAFLQ